MRCAPVNGHFGPFAYVVAGADHLKIVGMVPATLRERDDVINVVLNETRTFVEAVPLVVKLLNQLHLFSAQFRRLLAQALLSFVQIAGGFVSVGLIDSFWWWAGHRFHIKWWSLQQPKLLA